MKKNLVVIFLIALAMLVVSTACEPVAPTVNDVEQAQQAQANKSIVENQPAPDLGGYSFERQILIETYLARNNTISTFAYLFTYDGKIVEICPSIGYPIPYSTQLTNPMKIENLGQYSSGIYTQVIPNAEPNGLYPPENAAATLVQCVQPDGSVAPVYVEQEVMAFPYRIQSDYQMVQAGKSSFSVKVKK